MEIVTTQRNYIKANQKMKPQLIFVQLK